MSFGQADRRHHQNGIQVASNLKEPCAFLLRLWFEPTGDAEPEGEWRGRITDLVSLEGRYFRGLAGLTQYLADHTGAPAEHEDDPVSAPSSDKH
jgi:hypothetical protein